MKKSNTRSDMVLLGIGGGGCRLAASVRASYGEGMEALGLDTDALANRCASASGLECLLLGGARLAGQGTGGEAIQGRLAAQDDLLNLLSRFNAVRTAVVVTCLGGGTGSGAAAEIIGALRKGGIATIAFVTTPFTFEGEARRREAARALPLIEEHTDSLVVMPLDDLFHGLGEEHSMEHAIAMAEGIAASGITLLWRLLTKPGFLSLDPERLHQMILRGGNARFGFATAAGVDRAVKAVAALRDSRLLNPDGAPAPRANALLLGILAGADLRLTEIGEIMRNIGEGCRKECHIEMGTVLDTSYDGRVELVALAFENWSRGATDASKEPETASDAILSSTTPKRSGRGHGRGQPSKLSHSATGQRRFQSVEPTLLGDQDLDVPTYQRRGIRLER